MKTTPIPNFISRFIIPGMAVTLLALSILACNISGADGGVHLGQNIPEDTPVVKLAAVLENPTEYNGKNIVVKGIVSSQCSTLCHFTFQDGVHVVTIFPQGFKFPKLERGKPVTLLAQVISGQGQVVFSAIGLKM